MLPYSELTPASWTLAARRLTLGAGMWLAAVTAHAQITYLSESRSIALSGHVSGLPGPNYVTHYYSGDFGAAASPSGPYADFAANLNGNAELIQGYAYKDPDGTAHEFTNTISLSGQVTQSSVLTSQGLQYQSSLGFGGCVQGEVQHQLVLAQGLVSSSVQVCFSVSSPVTYAASIWDWDSDPFFSQGQCSLSGAEQGTLFSLSSFGNAHADYSGLLLPGETYTLTISEMGSVPQDLATGSLQLMFLVPEPSVNTLAGLAVAVFLFWRSRVRNQTEQGLSQ